ncbi:MAG: type I 3-dehydroquinate dehydratase [Elusimicrobiota bacterium]|nr:type I 3-dehydroquinate dehydratase [Endomicrobiia bacterium]MDW8166014.1 type I 3-dehydroquinate dehydratase [Elusimicrobiota bacterium]
MKIVCVLTNNLPEKQILKIKKFRKFIYALEIRVDTFYPNIEKIKDIIYYIKKHLPKIKIILTFRKFEEGGRVKIKENIRKKIIKNLIYNLKESIHFIDIEFNSKIKNEIYKEAKKYKKLAIFSIHFLNSFKEKEIYKYLYKIKKFIKIRKINNYIVKIVINISDFKKYFDFLKKIHKIFKNFKKYTFFTTGKTSLISRAISIILDMALVYVSIDKPVIKTQPDISQLLATLKKFGKNLN